MTVPHPVTRRDIRHKHTSLGVQHNREIKENSYNYCTKMNNAISLQLERRAVKEKMKWGQGHRGLKKTQGRGGREKLGASGTM